MALELQKDWLLYEKNGAVATITLNRPDKLNAMPISMIHGLGDMIREAEKDDDLKVIVLKGNGRSFSVGLDLAEAGKMYGIETPKPGERARRPHQRWGIQEDRKGAEDFRSIMFSLKVIIAQVQGHCLGISWMLTQACDMIVASDDAEFGHPEMRIGASGASMSLAMEMLAAGPHKAREMALLGRRVSAVEADRLNLINRVVPLGQLDAEVKKMAEAVCALPKDGIAIGKAYTHMTFDKLGLGASHLYWYGVHPMILGIRFGEGDKNLFKVRRDSGLKAFHQVRDERFPEDLR